MRPLTAAVKSEFGPAASMIRFGPRVDRFVHSMLRRNARLHGSSGFGQPIRCLQNTTGHVSL